MNKNGITKDNMLFVLPPALKEDAGTRALAEMEADALTARLVETDLPRILSNIDSMDEEVLDILARDFKVDWWDPNYTIEEKRATLKDSFQVHKKMGTKAAVERAISAIYPDTEVHEWFEYGGQPYHFRLTINIGTEQEDTEKQRRVLERLNFYKNVRSHLDDVEYFIYAGPAVCMAGGVFTGSHAAIAVNIPVPPEVGKPHIRFNIKTGAALGVYHGVVAAQVRATGDIHRPHVEVAAGGGAALYATNQRISVEIPTE